MGAARDLDVLIQDISTPDMSDSSEATGLTQLLDTARSRRQAAYEVAGQALSSTRASRFSNRLETWIEGRGWRSPENKRDVNRRCVSAKDFAQHRLNRCVKKMRTVYKKVGSLSIEDRHALRIDVKKTRYGLIFFSSVLPKKRSNQFMETLKYLQDNLGHLSDLAVAERTIETILNVTNDKFQKAQIEAGCDLILRRHRKAAAQAETETVKLWRKFKRIRAF